VRIFEGPGHRGHSRAEPLGADVQPQQLDDLSSSAAPAVADARSRLLMWREAAVRRGMSPAEFDELFDAVLGLVGEYVTPLVRAGFSKEHIMFVFLEGAQHPVMQEAILDETAIESWRLGALDQLELRSRAGVMDDARRTVLLQQQLEQNELKRAMQLVRRLRTSGVPDEDVEIAFSAILAMALEIQRPMGNSTESNAGL